MLYSRIFGLIERDGSRASLLVPPEWKQGRAVFGGLQAALAVDVMRQVMPRHLPLRSLQMTFMAPLVGDRLSMSAVVLREGKHTLHVEARLREGDAVLATATGVFGEHRASALRVLPVMEPVSDESPVPSRFIPGVTPSFLQHFRSVWLCGTFPGAGSLSTRATIVAELVDEGLATEAHLIAFGDYMPPLALSAFAERVPGSSMNWMLEILDDSYLGQPLQGWRLDAGMQAATGGYTSQSAVIWSPQGAPVALSRQTMAVFG